MHPIEQARTILSGFGTPGTENTFLSRISPRTLLLTTLLYIVAVLSVGKYDVPNLIPYFAYPVIVSALAGISFARISCKTLPALPFLLLIGIWNPILDHTPLFTLGEYTVTAGWCSFAALMLRGYLAILATILLLYSTGLPRLSDAMRRLHIPAVITGQILFTFRYLDVLLEEASSMGRACRQRNFGQQQSCIRTWSALTGHLLLRTLDRAQRLHHALLARGYNGTIPTLKSDKLHGRDYAYLLLWLGFLLLLFFTHPAEQLGKFIQPA